MLQTERLRTLDEVCAVIDGNQRVDFQIADRESAYDFIRRTLVRFHYLGLSKPDRGVIRRYLAKMTGLSRAQLTRLIRQYRDAGRIVDRRGKAPAKPFRRRYTPADIRRLAEVDATLGVMSGPATRAVMRREFEVFGDPRFERLARLSNGHLYNLRKSRTYRLKHTTFTRTRPVPIAIGERRKPKPNGQPGFLRVDTVHQGDRDGAKGVYHINTVDEVTQYEHIGSVEAISEGFLIPVLEALITAYPFVIQGFHADNGSEYINHQVAALLNKLHIGQFTKSRARRSNDNAPGRGQKRRRGAQIPRLRPHPKEIRPAAQRLQPQHPVPVFELPPALPVSHRNHRPERTPEKTLPRRRPRHPLRKTQIPAQCLRLPQTRRELCPTRRPSLRHKRPQRRQGRQPSPQSTVRKPHPSTARGRMIRPNGNTDQPHR